MTDIARKTSRERIYASRQSQDLSARSAMPADGWWNSCNAHGFVLPNEAVEKLFSYPHRAVNQNKYQGQTKSKISETAMARYKHIDTRPRPDPALLGAGLVQQTVQIVARFAITI